MGAGGGGLSKKESQRWFEWQGRKWSSCILSGGSLHDITYSFGQEVMGMSLDPVLSSDFSQVGQGPCPGRRSVTRWKGQRRTSEKKTRGREEVGRAWDSEPQAHGDTTPGPQQMGDLVCLSHQLVLLAYHVWVREMTQIS